MPLQSRGGRGVTGARMRDNDTVEEVVHVMDHDTVLFFSPDGICRSLKAYQIPVSSKTAMGAPLTQVCTPFIDLPPALDPDIGRHRAWGFGISMGHLGSANDAIVPLWLGDMGDRGASC